MPANRPHRPTDTAPITTASRISHYVESLRDQLAGAEALPQLTLLGLLTGIIAGAVIVLFRWAVELPLGYFLPDSFENFEAISSPMHFALPVTGAIVLGLVLQLVDKRHHATSIGHVMDRLQNHQGRMPLGNVVTQFFGGAACLLTGQSVGREGPAVHLGAGSGSLLGQWLKLPANSLRPLAGCGVAAAIAACFNTPMAGVIFAMEVVILEYTIAGFIPVTLAAVAGATMTRLAFGPEIAFINAQSVMGDLRELPLMGLVGLVVAVFAAAYIRLHGASCRWALHRPIALRFALAGLFTGICALWIPQIMGVGYDTISSALAGEIGFALLLAIAITKLLATSLSLGMGMPGGVVGPLLFIGACVGGAVGSAAQLLMPGSASAIGFYVILGMGAMMGATLNAPLAAMMAILELTYNPNIIFPSMLVVIAACLTTRWVFRCDGLFQHVLRIQGKFRSAEAMEQLLSRTGVRGAMDRHLVVSDSQISLHAAQQLLARHPHWILVRDNNQLLQPADLHTYLQTLTSHQPTDERQEMINLQEIPARRYDLARIAADANLFEALELMNRQQLDALWVESLSDSHQPLGIISRRTIDNYYRI
ncbi:chloride channel protein [Cellvibrio sp. PSBB023]|uniref:chloride channel protein n=1 Tax=Cellvibrio sp. PSBB023 TaxID=1945512 RepID=UPI0009C321EB|nr:chloride channel protein [Cellvibrio sp. PSBB023]AQT60545.1 voltage-gated chloride channel [Cellvibrio sp. PSBB023]